MTSDPVKEVQPLPKVPDPGTLEEHGITIPAPTPTSINIPNPWHPAANGERPGQGPAADSGESTGSEDPA